MARNGEASRAHIPVDVKVFNFEQCCRATYSTIAASSRALQGGTMADPKNEKHADYVRYAKHCLEITHEISDQDHRAINREMAAEWLKLADDIIELSTPIKRSA
jgi:hypothetical protein